MKTSKAEKTREFIIGKAAPLFNTKGYGGTSLQDLTAATGLSKGAIYGNFENKDEVAVAAYNYQVALLDRRINDFLRDKPTCLGRLLGITDYYRSNWKRIFEKGGCPVLNASVEADDNFSALKKPVRNSIQRWAYSIQRLIEKGQYKNEFKKNIVAEDYAYTIITQLEGGIMMGKAMNSQKLLFMALDRIDAMIHREMKN